jgi:hypothetical protein
MTGLFSGNNCVFYTPDDYKPGSIILFYNGQALFKDDDFKEISSNSVELIYIHPTDNTSLKASYIKV